MARYLLSPELLAGRQPDENAREDAGEQAYDNYADVQPREARLVKVACGRAFVCGAEVTLIS